MSVKNTDPGDLRDRIDELEAQVRELQNNLIHDPLTGLKTRAYFDTEVSTLIETILKEEERNVNNPSQRKERLGYRSLSVVFFDIDHFKEVNDTYGHDVGDLVLQKVSKTIPKYLRTGDTVARWGGEEIVVSLLGANEANAKVKAEEIRKAIDQLSFEAVPDLRLTISAGVATCEKGLSLTQMIKRADQALYAAKNSGRNQVVTYNELPE